MTNDKPETLLYKKMKDSFDVPSFAIAMLLETASLRQLSKGDIVLRSGKVCKTIFFVEKGYLRTYIDNDGIAVNTDFSFEGQFTTDLKSLRSAAPSNRTIQAGEQTTIYEFDKDVLSGLYQLAPEIESFGRKLLEQLLIATEDHADLFKIYSIPERYSYVQQNRPELLQRISISQLASYLGTTRETISRIRKNK